MNAFQSFLEALKQCPWGNSAVAHEEARRALRALLAEPGALREEVATWPGDIRSRARLCHETSTHYKWFVYGDPEERFVVWLHQYKPSSIRGTQHAAVPHNHRYWFSSAIFAGGLHQRAFHHFENDENGNPRLAPKSELVLRAGDAYVVAPEEIHAMFHIEDDTLSLVVQGRPVRNYSEVYDLATGEVRRFPDFIGQLPSLQDAVRLVT